MESTSESRNSRSFSLSYFLIKSQFFWQSYLPLPIPWYNQLISTFSCFICLTFFIRAAIYNYVPLEPVSALYMGDYAYNFGSIHDIIWFIHLFWYTATVFAFNLLNKSNRSVKLQTWFTCLTILDQGKDDFFVKPNEALILASKLLFISAKSSLLFGLPFTFSLFIPHMINNYSNAFLFLMVSIHGLIIVVAGFAAIAFCVNMSYLFSFYAFLIGQKLTKIAKTFKSQMDSKSIFSHRKISSNSSRLIRLLKQVYCANFFWSKFNSNVFINTFFPQILILYSIFFVPLNKIHLIALFGLGSLNFACGQSINFISGAYARSKLNHCQRQLRRVIFTNGCKLKITHKMKLLIISEYLLHRKLFAVFESLEMNSFNYSLVFIEMAAHLMLVIVNANRK
uniref:Gustatory receptor n=1 Tax=Tetranychus urticae TaxID=32264 RepID=T1JU69_TETUR